jgi:DNA polymerase-1
LPLQVDAVTKRIHTDYMQTVAATGDWVRQIRICKTSLFVPNGDKIRKAFIARDENYTIISADYSKLRIIAALSGEKTW